MRCPSDRSHAAQIAQAESAGEQHAEEGRTATADEHAEADDARPGVPAAPLRPLPEADAEHGDHRRARSGEAHQVRPPARLAHIDTVATQREPELREVEVAR